MISSSFGRSRLALVVTAIALLLVVFTFYNRPTGLQTLYPSRIGAHDILDDIANRTLGFQKIFVINLPTRTDLRDTVSLAAAFTDLDVEFVDGVIGSEISQKALPNGAIAANLSYGGLGNWRAHMNIARIIVEQNIQSALVLENDADWDIRIKSQMRQFAKGSRLIVQPLKGTNDTFLDPTNPRPQPQDMPSTFDISDDKLAPQIIAPTTSPYGDLDRWDLLWLGHCGCRFPWSKDGNAPLARAAIFNDETVPELNHVNIELGDYQLIEQYPAHTRVVSRARVNSCTLGHAFSQKGARLFLYELALKELSDYTDMGFRYMCDGVGGRPLATCLTVQPQLFQHHRPRGLKSSQSDIDDHGTDFNEHAQTANVRWSTRVNFPRLVAGRTDFHDMWPDGTREPNWAEGQV